MRFELTTPTLARLCSTTELRPLLRRVMGQMPYERGYMTNSGVNCKPYSSVTMIFLQSFYTQLALCASSIYKETIIISPRP